MDPMEMIKKLMSGEIRMVVVEKPASAMPKLADEERELAQSLVNIAKKYGKFNEDETGIWAGYEKAKDNMVAQIGVKCANCVLYEGNGVCKVIAQTVEPEGKCRFAIIPDGVVKGIYKPESGPMPKRGMKKRS